jgi:hypothetical protein
MQSGVYVYYFKSAHHGARDKDRFSLLKVMVVGCWGREH